MRSRSILLAIQLLGTTACIDALEPPVGRFGSIAAAAYENGAGPVVLHPEAVFYDQTDVSYTPTIGDTCVIAMYVPIATLNTGLPTLDAGAFLFTSIGGRVDTMTAPNVLGLRIYKATRTAGIPYTPGDTLAITIPGAASGFPASVISIRTAEAFTHDSIGVPAANIDLPIAWTAAPSAGSQMTFSLRYANSFSSGALNEQVFCSFTDDGSATIRADFLGGWRAAVNGNRSTRAVRIRSREIVVDSRTRLAIISSYGQPLLSTAF